MLTLSMPAPARAGRCGSPEAFAPVQAALAVLEQTIDPCGEGTEVAHLVQRLRRCAAPSVRVCLDHEAKRNFTEYGDDRIATITWNPSLTAELERRCGSDPGRAVLRDPVASLLHEVVHAVQVCAELDPTAHELEAVRIENVYRRARGLCQRTRYGDAPLPPVMQVACEPGRCSCRRSSVRTAAAAPPAVAVSTAPHGAAGDGKGR